MVSIRGELREILVLLALFTAPIFAGTSPAGPAVLMISLAIRSTVFILVVLYIIDVRRRRTELLPRGPVSPGQIVAIPVTAIVLLGLSVAVRSLTRTIPALQGSTTAAQQIMQGLGDHSTLGILLLVIPAMVLVGYSEELFFRAYLIGQFRHLSLTPTRAVTAAAALFAMGHVGQGPAALLFAFLAALFLGVVWLRLPRIHVLALGHSVYNIASLLFAWDGQTPPVVLY